MLIDHTYFEKGTRQIQNATLGKIPSPDSVNVCRQIEEYISEYQEDYLRGVLGESTGNKVHNYLVCLDEDEEPKHIEEFDKVCDCLKESFADYIFFHILRDINDQTTMTGFVRLKCANTYVSPIRKQVNVWNTMVDRHRRLYECNIIGSAIKSDLLTKINHFNL